MLPRCSRWCSKKLCWVFFFYVPKFSCTRFQFLYLKLYQKLFKAFQIYLHIYSRIKWLRKFSKNSNSNPTKKKSNQRKRTQNFREAREIEIGFPFPFPLSRFYFFFFVCLFVWLILHIYKHACLFVLWLYVVKCIKLCVI